MIFFAADSYAQGDQVWSIGAGIGASIGVNEAIHQAINPQFNLSLLWLNGIAPHWSVEANVGFGKISSVNQGGYSEYSTYISPYDIRVRYAPLERNDWQPFIYAGVGLLSYNVTSRSIQASRDAKLISTTAFLPLGIGLYHPLDKNWAVEGSIGENPSFSDDLNPVHDNRNDAFWGFKIEISYRFGEKNIVSDEFDLGPRGTSQILTGVSFDSAGAKLQLQSEKILSQVLEALNNHADIEVEFRSYLDDSYDFITSMGLTHDRAEALKVWFVSRGISASRISTQGYGPHNPLVQNTTPENMEKNRRIEIVRMK